MLEEIESVKSVQSVVKNGVEKKPVSSVKSVACHPWSKRPGEKTTQDSITDYADGTDGKKLNP